MVKLGVFLSMSLNGRVSSQKKKIFTMVAQSKSKSIHLVGAKSFPAKGAPLKEGRWASGRGQTGNRAKWKGKKTAMVRRQCL
jgi:hypothetical protein